MELMLSPLAQGFGVCRPDGVILIPEASGAVPSYSAVAKNGKSEKLYGHFVPIPKTYLTRRGDIILFTENACDILYLEQMYSKKIRELYEQQIKTVHDLNRCILFYGSKNPGEYSLNFVRGRFYGDRDVSIQPGHLPTHYLHTLTRNIKLSSALRPRAPAVPGFSAGSTPYLPDPAVKNIKLPSARHEAMDPYYDELDDDRMTEETVKPPTPINMNKLPPIQVSQRYEPRPAGAPPSKLHKVGMDSGGLLGLSGSSALPPPRAPSEVPVLPKVATGPSAKGRSRTDWRKLGNLINSIGAMKRVSLTPQKPTVPEEAKRPEPAYMRNLMAMDIQFLRENRRHINGSHAGVYLTQLLRDGEWRNEDVPVYVTPDGRVFISSVIVNQPVCSSDRVRFTQQDDADDVHRKPEEGSLTFADGQLNGWVKFKGQEPVRIKGKRWDPRQTGSYILEKKKSGPAVDEEAVDEEKREDWKVVPLTLSIMLGGKVTANDDPVFNPMFEEDGLLLHLRTDEFDDVVVSAKFDDSCNRFSGVLEDEKGQVAIRGRKWNPSLVGRYYTLTPGSDGQSWVPLNMPVAISEEGELRVGGINVGVPNYNGNTVDVRDLDHDSLPTDMTMVFQENKFSGYMRGTDGKQRPIRGIKWDPSMVGNYSTQEKQGDLWVNKNDTLVVGSGGEVALAGDALSNGFIVDNKVFVAGDKGIEDYFNNTGPVSDASLAGQSFLMNRDSPIKNLLPPESQVPASKKSKAGEEVKGGEESASIADRPIKEAEMVFSSNRFYGHLARDGDQTSHTEIRGYKWDANIAGDYFTEMLKESGAWGAGPAISISESGAVSVNGRPVTDTLLKDNIVSISGGEEAVGVKPFHQCLIAVQDKLVTGWVQLVENGPKIQIRGSLWKEGPSQDGVYVCSEKSGDEWVSSDKSVIVTTSKKVRIAELGLEGELDGLTAELEPVLPGGNVSGLLRFTDQTVAGTIKTKESGEVVAEISGFKFEAKPGVYLLESRPLGSEEPWSGLNLQMVVSDNSQISVGEKPVHGLRCEEEGVLLCRTDTALESLSVKFGDEVLGTGVLRDGKDQEKEVEVRGRTWYPKIAGTYETEIFTGSGWKPAKKLEITPQGNVFYGGERADGVTLDTDTMAFEFCAPLQDVTLAFDANGFSGNAVTVRDQKTRVMRGRRVGTRPVSANHATELQFSTEEEDNFDDLNGQIGSRLPSPAPDTIRPLLPLPPPPAGVTSDYGSASDVITHASDVFNQPAGTDVLSSLEEGDFSMGSRSLLSSSQKPRRDSRDSSGRPGIGESEREGEVFGRTPGVTSRRASEDTSKEGTGTVPERSSPRVSGKGSDGASRKESVGEKGGSDRSESSGKHSDVNLDEIGIDLSDKTEPEDGGPSFETWPPERPETLTVDPTDGDGDGSVQLDILPRGLSPLTNGDKKSTQPGSTPSVASNTAAKSREPSANLGASPAAQGGALSGESDRSGRVGGDGGEQARGAPTKLANRAPTKVVSPSVNAAADSPALVKNTRTPLPAIPPKTLDTPALTKPVKLPGIEMKEKGGAAEITTDAGVLKNYIDPPKKAAAKGEKKKRKKKVKAKNELLPRGGGGGGGGDQGGDSGATGVSTDQEAPRSSSRATPIERTPLPLSRIDRDSSRDSTPTSPPSNGFSSAPSREFQGALMAAKKIKEVVDPLDGKIPSDIREHPVAEEVAEKFGVEMKVRNDDGGAKLSVKEKRELARQKKRDDAERKRRERDEERRKQKEEEERRAAEEEEMRARRAEREAELAADRERELQRRRDEEAARRRARQEERAKKVREEEKMQEAKKRLEEELKRRREAEAARLAEIERQKQLELEREKEEQARRFAEAEALRQQMQEEMAREMEEYERKMREEEERRRIEEALKAEAERRLLDEAERQRIIALARHLWNKGVRIEGEHLQQELEISSIFYSYFNYLESSEPFNSEIDVPYSEKLARVLPKDKV